MAWYDPLLDIPGKAASAVADNAGSLALGTAGLALAKQGYDRLGDIGDKGYERMSGTFSDTGELLTPGLAQELQGMMEFQPYTVTTATGGQFGMGQGESSVDAAGNVVPGGMNYQLDLSENERLFQDAQLGRAESMFGLAAENPYASPGLDEEGNPLPSREQQVFQRMMDSINPQRERERLALEGRLQSQGRLGVQTSMFGGTPEGLAMAKAQEEAYSKNMLGAMEFAGQEQQRQAQLGSGMLASSYIPQSQLLNAVQPGMTAAEQRRQAISEQTQSYGETYATGLEALLQAAYGQANIAGGVGSSMATAALGSLFS